MNRTLTQCQRCRYNIIETFAALAGVSLQPLSSMQRAPSSRQNIPCITNRRFTVSSRIRQADLPDPSSTSTTPTLSITSESSSKPPPSIPWYLQVETPTPPAPISPHLAIQELPPVPSDAPEIVLPILNHLSDQIGLDNLSLLDLRHLDPPPALGANLIMIIGTARSYKHLNTSADRFCRWLRSRYKLAPYADGLLGRNELKLKLRRKARKLKLAQSVGNTVAMNNADDGITTGWICVNLGSIENARIPEDEKSVLGTEMSRVQQEELSVDEEEYENPEDASAGYIGFGSRSTAPRIVVQMFIEEKRLEMDLEGLWDYRQERRAQKAERIDTQARQRLEDISVEHGEPSQHSAAFKPWAK